MSTHPDTWIYGDRTPDPLAHDLVGLKARWIVDHLPAEDRPSVLDFGVGEGKYLRLVKKSRPEAQLAGVDVRDPHTQPFFEFHKVAEESALPFSDDYFDLVVSCDVLEHVGDIQHSLDEILRVMRPGGRFIGFVPLEGGFRPHALFRLFNRNIYRDTKDHHHAYRRKQMQNWLSARFCILDIAYSYHLLGATMDAVFFASFKLPSLGPRVEAFWRGQENVVYRGSPLLVAPSMLGQITQIASRIAYWESRILYRLPFGAVGFHFCLEKH
jgi:SAM-dependent methyltransferase